MGYDAAVFDMDGVLVGHTPADARRAAVRAGFEAVGVDPDPGDLRAVVERSDAAASVCSARGVDPADFYDAYGEAMCRRGLDLVAAGEKPAYDDLGAVRDLDVPVGVVSNNYRPVVEAVLDREDLRGVVDTAHGTTPGAAGRAERKPAPVMLERATAALGAASPLFVGDSNADLGAAAAAGVDAAYLRRPARADYELEYTPAHEVRDLRAVAALVDGGRA